MLLKAVSESHKTLFRLVARMCGRYFIWQTIFVR